jgi:hypothetical protein
MQKITLWGLLVLLSSQVFAQSENLKLGFRVGTFVSTNGVEGTTRFANTQNNGAAIRLSVGPTADYFFAEKYALSTGLFYTVKRAGFFVPKSFFDDTFPATGQSQEANYNVQYLQVPATIKLFTEELAPQTRFMIQFGASVDVKLAEKPLLPASNVLHNYYAQQNKRRVFGFGDACLVLGIGAEYDLGRAGDALSIALTYYRGLADVTRDKDLFSKNNLIGLEFGVKF